MAIALIVPVLIVIARPGHRRETARASVRPLLVGILSALLLIVVAAPPIPVVTDGVARVVASATNDVVRVPIIRMTVDLHPTMIPVLLIVLMFFVAAAYLAQRNGLCANINNDVARLIAPIVCGWSAWWVAVSKLGAPSAAMVGLAPWQYLLSAVATPATVTVLAAIEIRKLRIQEGLRFRTRVAVSRRQLWR